jgi:hypothetical protein
MNIGDRYSIRDQGCLRVFRIISNKQIEAGLGPDFVIWLSKSPEMIGVFDEFSGMTRAFSRKILQEEGQLK